VQGPPFTREESELIRAAARGDRTAFDEIVRRKRERLVRTAYQVTGDMEDALDVVQGVFLKLWRGLDRYDPRWRFDTWLYKVTVNAAIDAIRARGARGFEEPLPDEPDQPLTAVDPGAEEALELGELRRAFLHLASKLAPKQRTAFVLREIEGLDTAEVAEIMDVSESTVRNHLMQARRILRAGIERDYPGLVPRAGRSGSRSRGPA
jgi:RNA polymerase sigma-70 factor (ECF subfamily)